MGYSGHEIALPGNGSNGAPLLNHCFDTSQENTMGAEQVIITFSHLRWNFVYQRPQHLLSRLAKKRRIFFIEEPVWDPSGVLSWERSEPEPNVIVCTPHTPVRSTGFTEEQKPHLRRLVNQLV